MRKLAYALLVLCAGCLSEPKPAGSGGGDGGADDGGGNGDGGDGDAAGPPRVVEIATGFSHTCARISDGRVRCWGSNVDGRLGYGNTATVDRIGDNEPPADAGDVDIGGVALQVVAGNAHTCVLLEGGDVRCWGRNGSGQCGYGNLDQYGDNEPASAAPLTPLGGMAIALTAGSDSTCALMFGTEGDIICWGSSTGTGTGGELGYGNSNANIVLPNVGDDELPSVVGPAPIANQAITSVSSGPFHACAVLTPGGFVRCWGQDNNHQLGIPGGSETYGDNETAILAPSVTIGSETRRIDTGASHTCALSAVNGLVTCWGFGGVGALGYGNTNTISDGAGETPQSAGTVTLNAEALQLVVGPQFTCALLDDADDQVRCWGDPSSNGRLGIGIEIPDKVGDDELPINRPSVRLGGTVESLSVSNGLSGHTCAILTSGDVRCWGDNTDGQLGYGHTDPIGDTELPDSEPAADIL